MLRTASVVLTLGASITFPALSAIQFLASDGNKLYRADSTGAVQAAVTLPHEIQSLTFVPGGLAVPGASGGDIIACARSAVAGSWAVYRVTDAFGVAPSLVQIGSTNFGVGSMVFAGAELYAVNDTLGPIRVSRLNPANFSVIQTWNTGINATGGGGIAWDSIGQRMLLTNGTANTLMSWTPSGGASTIGAIGFGFSNNGLEFLNGTLYGAIRPDANGGTLRMGSFNLATGAFTTLATANGILGNGTGFVAIPAPGVAALIGLFGLRTAIRRR